MESNIPVRDIIKMMDQLIAMMRVLKSELERLDPKSDRKNAN